MDLTSKIIKKYAKKSIPQLRAICKKVCHEYIRKRDDGKPCVCCPGRYVKLEAGHFYAAGSFPNLEFDEVNIHGQAKNCNYFNHGNTNEYRKHIIERIGDSGLKYLDWKASEYKRNGWKWDRFYLIEKIEYYKIKLALL